MRVSVSIPSLDIQPCNVNILDGNARDLEEECVKYEEKIKRYGGIELFLGGIGVDGHIAFNEPGSSLSSRTRIKTLAYDTVVANGTAMLSFTHSLTDFFTEELTFFIHFHF